MAPPHKYSVSLAGVGMSSADSVVGLSVDGMRLEQMVVAAVSSWDQQQQQLGTRHRVPRIQRQSGGCVWLDIQSPSEDDISALASIFDIDSTTVRHLMGGLAGKQPVPECTTADTALYLCWAETAASGESAQHYVSHGTAEATTADPRPDDAGGYVPVPPWLQPSATQVLARLNLGKRRRRTEASEREEAVSRLETARRDHVRQMLTLLDRPLVANKERTRSALRHWGPEYELWWQEVLASIGPTPPRQVGRAARIAEHLSRGACDMVGYRLVQAWTRGPVLLTFHAMPSATVAAAMAELARPGARLRSADVPAIILHLVARWITATRDCLQVVENHADRLDHDLTRPVQTLSTEAASWTPVIARCRKVALALLRQCQANEAAVVQLRTAFGALRLASSGTKHTHIHEDEEENRLWRQHSSASAILRQCKKVEQRLSRLHTILLDRQYLRLLSTQRAIHQYFRILVSVTLVFLPIELWYNLDNLNGITTPGKLQPKDASDEDFYLTVLGMMVWAVAAVLIYSVYIKFFERSPEALRVTNIASLKRKQGHLQRRWLQQQQQQQQAQRPAGTLLALIALVRPKRS
ncbi:hypothetical protein EV174_001150 [Coemansia sp. RSA 2320]|nr:hypothetical protein EV174_001150 [Coemansia sp. RSA 2320]